MREKLIEVMKDTRANAAWHRWSYEESADHLIVNDVVQVVRCKDCKHTRKKNRHEQFMYNENICICTKEDIWGITKNEPVWDDFFCAYGERKDESE